MRDAIDISLKRYVLNWLGPMLSGLIVFALGIVVWAIGHLAAVWAARRDPAFVDVVRRHLRYPAHLGV